MDENVSINRQHKDRLFRALFSSSKENALALYNALNNSSYEDAEALEFNSIDDVVFLGMKNDVSYLFHQELNVYEQNSTPYANLPLRGLFYISRLLEGWVAKKGLDLYGTKQVKIPTPHYVVFYNGTTRAPETEELKLSEAYIKPGGCLELTVKVYNINKGHNGELLRRCRPLYEYAELIGLIRENQAAGMEIGEATLCAVDDCIARGVLAEYLRKHKAEVIGMLLTEYDETRRRALDRKEGYDEGYDKGRDKGRTEGYDKGRTEGYGEGERSGSEKTAVSALRSLVQSMNWTLEQAAAAMGITPEEQERYIRLAGGKA